MQKLLHVLILLLLIASCTKPATVEEQLIQQRKEDSAFNQSQVNGMGNLFFTEKLIANKKSQHVMTFTIDQDTLAAYGRIDSTGKLRHIHTLIMGMKGQQKKLVSEILPDQLKARLYMIGADKKKSRTVVEIEHLSESSQLISLLEMNWTAGTSKVLTSTLLENGTTIASFSTTTVYNRNRAWNCDEPQPSEDMVKAVENYLDYFRCGGHACDSYPACQSIKNRLISIYNKAQQIISDFQEKDFATDIHNWSNTLSERLDRLKGKWQSLKSEKTRLDPHHQSFEDDIQEIDINQPELDIRALGNTHSILTYDEVNGGELKLVVEVFNKKANLPHTEYPVFVAAEWIDPTTNTLLLRQSNTTVSGGMAIFRTDPSKLPNFKKYDRIKIQFGLVRDDYSKWKTTQASLKFIKPKLNLLDNTDVPPVFQVKQGQNVSFKIVNEDGRNINYNHNKVSIANVSNSKVSVQRSTNLNYFNLYFSSLDGKTQDASVDVLHDNIKIQTLNFRIYIEPDSTDYYKAAVVGSWNVRFMDTGTPYNTTMVIEPGGRGYYISAGYPGGKGYISWYIVKLGEGEGYKFYETGHWHPAFNGSPRTRLTPSLSFYTYSNFDATKITHHYSK